MEKPNFTKTEIAGMQNTLQKFAERKGFENIQEYMRVHNVKKILMEIKDDSNS